MHDHRALHAELPKGAGHQFRNGAVVNARQLRGRAGRVRKRAYHVEDRPDAQGLSERRHVAENGVHLLREEEADAVLADALLHAFRGSLEVEAQGLEHVRRAALT